MMCLPERLYRTGSAFLLIKDTLAVAITCNITFKSILKKA